MMLITPPSVQMTDPPEKMKERKQKNGYRNGTTYTSLETQVKYDPKFKGLLKTPSEFDGTVASPKKNPVTGDSGSLAQEMMCGYVEKRGFLLPTPNAGEAEHYRLQYTPGSQMGTSLTAMGASGLLPTPRANAAMGTALETDFNHEPDRCRNLETVIGKMMLPTPTARDEKNPSSPDGERIARKKEQGYTIELNDLAAMGTLPTPSARDWKGKTNPGVTKEGSGCVYGETLPDTIGRVCDPNEDGQSFRLSPLFTEEMMGFPFGWTTLPFLSQSGEPNPSKPTGTQSSRK